MADSKVTKIRIEYEDGTIKESTGEDAQVIMDWFDACQDLAFNHGFEFNGKSLQTIQEPTKPKTE